MPEPLSSVSTTLIINIGVVTLIGSVFGMPIEAMSFGLMGGLVMLALNKTTTRLLAFTYLAISVLLSGLISPAIASYLYIKLSDVTFETSVLIRNAIAFILGATWQWFLPLIQKKIKQFINLKTEKDDERSN